MTVIGTFQAFDHHLNLGLTDVTAYDGDERTLDLFLQRSRIVKDVRPHVEGEGEEE